MRRPWLRDVVKAYSTWTSASNGSDLEEGEEADSTPHAWNEAHFKLLAHCLPGLTAAQIDETALALILGLPDEAFFDVMTIFLHSVDAVYFSDLGLQEAQGMHVRTVLARRLIETRQWTWQSRDRSTSISTRLGPAIAVMFFNEYATFVPAKCYLLEKGIDRLGPFLPILGEVAQVGAFLFLAVTLLNLLEVSPRPEQLPLIVAVAKVWFATHPEDKEFWIEHAVGRRVCSVIEAIVALDPKSFGHNQAARTEIEGFLTGLIRLGVAEAHRLEHALGQIK